MHGRLFFQLGYLRGVRISELHGRVAELDVVVERRVLGDDRAVLAGSHEMERLGIIQGVDLPCHALLDVLGLEPLLAVSPRPFRLRQPGDRDSIPHRVGRLAETPPQDPDDDQGRACRRCLDRLLAPPHRTGGYSSRRRKLALHRHHRENRAIAG